MDKEILQKILRELTNILSKNEFIESMPSYDDNKTPEQNMRRLKTASNAHSRKYKVIEDLINKL